MYSPASQVHWTDDLPGERGTMPEAQQQDFLYTMLQPERLTAVVDIGANPIDGDPPYKPMLGKQLCEVVGFEPQPSALAALQEAGGPLERYLPHAIGDGQPHTLYECRASGMTSLFEPDPAALAMFNGFTEFGAVTTTSEVQTRRLDDVSEITALDMLKIDIQGGELAVFESGRETLAAAVMIQTEVSFMPLYRGQPLYAEIDLALRDQGFIPHAFHTLKRWPLTPFAHPQHHLRPVNQALEADVIYVRDFTAADAMTDEQLKHLALLAHHCYTSVDLTTLCLTRLAARHVVPADAVQRYMEHIFPNRPRPPAAPQTSYSFSFDS